MSNKPGNKLGLVIETNDEYHQDSNSISKSHLDVIANGSPKHYWQKYLNPNRERQEPTPAMIMGTAVHTAVLEPDLFPSEVIESPEFDRRSKVGKAEYEAFQLEHKGRIVLAPEDYATCLAIRDAVHLHPVAGGLLQGGQAEQSFYADDPETGMKIKCRVDYLHNSGEMIIDLKTTDDASPAGFGKSAANFRYPIQTAWYNGVLDAAFGEHPQDWVFLAIEKRKPYAVGIYFMEPDIVARAEIAARRDFMRIVECKRSGEWPDYGIEPQPLVLPGWSKL